MRPRAAAPPLDADLARRLRGVISRLRLCVLAEGAAWMTGFAILAVHVQFVLDYTRRLDLSMRAALLGVIVIATGVLAWRWVIRPLGIRMSLVDAAHLVERRNPRLGSALLSAVQFAEGEGVPAASNSGDMVASVVRGAADRAREADFTGVVDPRRAKRSGLVLLAMAAFGVVAIVTSPSTASLWFSRNILLQDVDWPKRTRLVVELAGHDIVAPRGDDFEVRVLAEGEAPRTVEMSYRTAGGKRGREAMVGVGERGYRYTFKKLEEDVTFFVAGGDDRTAEYRVTLADRPRVETLQLRITPPAYTRMTALTLGEGQRAAQVLPGSEVLATITTNKPVVSAELLAGAEVAATRSPGQEGYVFRLLPERTQTYHFALVDEQGLTSTPASTSGRLSIRVIADGQPTARLKAPGAGEMITPQAILPLEVEYTDAYGLATAELIMRLSREGAAEQPLPLEGFSAHAQNYATSLQFDAGATGLIPGERVAFQARASDFDDVSGPNFGQSQEIVLRVVTVDEMTEDLARREQEARAQLERLVDAQEQVRGRLLSVIADFRPGGSVGSLAEGLAPLERRQRNIAGSVNVVRQQLEQVLSEYRINQLSTGTVEERLGRQIVEPLGDLARRDLVIAADALRSLSRSGDPAAADAVDPAQADLVAKLRAVLAAMLQWEGYQEVVSMLRDILRLQEELNAEAQGEAVGGLDDIFED